jgi:putative GTP pyrophosphokinase
VPGYSKGAVNRAGVHLAARLQSGSIDGHPRVDELRDPDDLRARAVVEWWIDEHLAPMRAVQDVIYGLAPTIDLDGRDLRLVTSRPKRVATIVDKLLREPGKLSQMVDLGGVRAVVESMDDVDDPAEAIGRELSVTRAKDWARSPRASRYRALRLYIRESERNIEVQLRTRAQDMWANIVEQESYLSGLDYKSGGAMTVAPKLFLVSFDRQTQETDVIDLGSQPDLAMREYRDRERELLASGRNLEVVLLGAESEETLRRTHSSYFRQGNDMADLLHRDPA